ncbi:MAG: hypothetical protein AAGI07_02215 [Bacteroidota bacterium]
MLKRKCISVFSIGWLVIFVFTFACEQNKELAPNNVLIGEYQIIDLIVVNDENGVPQKTEDLNLLDHFLQLNNDGTFNMSKQNNGKLQNGNWIQSGSKLLLIMEDGSNFALSITQTDTSKLQLDQPFEAQLGFAPGVVYYEFCRI